MRTCRIRNLTLSAILCALSSATVMAEPVVEGPHPDRVECRLTHHLALTKYHSRDTSMNGPLTAAKTSPVHLALKAVKEGIYGSDTLVADPAYFRDVAPDTDRYRVRRIFWQLTPASNKRIVVVDRGFNWRGDFYSAYALAPNVTPQKMIDDTFRKKEDRRFKPVIDDSWEPLQVLTDPKSGKNWFLAQGSQFYAMRGWTVYAADGDDFRQRCTIGFLPEREAVMLLPRPAQRFAALQSEILGPGENEGTMQPTARIRASAESAWGTAILRPWALHAQPYNSRSEVEEGLKQWAAGHAKRRSLHQAMRQEYTRTEHVLAAHYRSHFRISSAEAGAMARYATDIIFRSYFVFNRSRSAEERTEAEGRPSANPWPVTGPVTR